MVLVLVAVAYPGLGLFVVARFSAPDIYGFIWDI